MRKQVLRRVMAGMLVAGLSVGIVPAKAEAISGTQIQQDAVLKENTETAAKAAEEENAEGTGPDTEAGTAAAEEYREGEVIISYYQSAISAYSAKSQMLLGPGMEIEDTCVFEDAGKLEDKPKSMSLGAGEDDLVFALVRSEQYTTEELLEKLEQNSNIISVEPNYTIHAMDMDPYEKYQWALENTGQNGGIAGLDINGEHLECDGTGEECVIALVDTGMNYTHPDLQDAVWNNTQGISGLGQHGYDCYNKDDDPMDDNGHGSHCAGIMAATADNGIGTKGIAKNSNIKIMPLKILDGNGTGDQYSSLTAYQKIYSAMQQGVNIVAINNSWGRTASDSYMQQMLQVVEQVGQLGALSICAAGNDGADNDSTANYPANSSSDYVISVAASNEKDELAGFSNYGQNNVDLAAPGANILSTVATNVFNPSIYEDKDKLCGTYEDFSDGNLVKTVGQNASGGLVSDNDIAYGLYAQETTAQMDVSLSGETYFGTESGRSLKWTVNNAKKGASYCLYLPYSTEVTGQPVYSSVMLKATGPKQVSYDFWGNQNVLGGAVYVMDSKMASDGIYDQEFVTISGCYADTNANYWNHFSGKVLDRSDSVEQRVMVIQLTATAAGNYTIYLDDMGISKANVAETEFGKYEYYNGTSMATPYVTGAVAAIANACPNMAALDIRKNMFDNVRKSANLTDKVSTGGVLDLSNIKPESDSVSEPLEISKVQKKDSGEIEIIGKNLSGAVVKIDGEVVEPKQISDESCLLDGTAYFNRTFTLRVEKGEDDYFEDSIYFADGKELTSVNGNVKVWDGGDCVSGGDAWYYVEGGGKVYYAKKKDTEELQWQLIKDTDFQNVSGVESNDNPLFEVVSGVVYNSSRLWAVLQSKDGGRILVSNMVDDTKPEYSHSWEKVADLPDSLSDLDYFTIGAYNGGIYLLGGYSQRSETLSRQVTYYDVTEQEWKNGVELPEGRAAAKALQTGKELVVTLGTGGDSQVPENLIFDGTTWKKSQAKLALADAGASEIYGKQTMTVYDAQIALVKDGILYAGCRGEGLGNIFYYKTKEDTFETASYMTDGTIGAVVTAGDQCYFWYDSEEENIACMPVESAVVQVTTNGMLEKSCYLPGDCVKVEWTALQDEYIKTILVNGEEIEGNGIFSYVVGDQDVSIQAQRGFYVTKVEIPESLTLEVGEQKVISCTVLPENADSKELEWTSSDPDVVSVDEQGRIFAEKASSQEIILRARAKDRNSVFAECAVTVNETATTQAITEENTEATTSQSTTERTTEATTSRATTERTTEVTTSRATTERRTEATTSRATTERTTEATTSRATTERRTEATTSRATTERTTEATTSRATTERTTEATTSRATTERRTEATTSRATTERTTEATTSRATTERRTEATTNRATTERRTEATTSRATTERRTEATTSRATTERRTEATTSRATTERRTEATTSRATTERRTEATTNRATTEEKTEATTELTGMDDSTETDAGFTMGEQEEITDRTEESTEMKDGQGDKEQITTEQIVPEQENIPVTKIILDLNEVSLNVNRTKKIYFAILPDNASDKQLSYSSSDENVATVDENGVIKTIAPGKAVITVLASSGCQETVMVKVKPDKVTGLKKAGLSSGKIKLSWKKQSGVTGYKVYRKNGTNGKYRLYKTTRQNYIKITNLKRNTSYSYKIRAYKKSGFSTIYGSYSKVYKITEK